MSLSWNGADPNNRLVRMKQYERLSKIYRHAGVTLFFLALGWLAWSAI